MTKKHITYRIDHPSGFYYIGVHSTDNINDSYMGSGVLIKRMMEITLEGWNKKILAEHPTRTLALAAEKRTIGVKWKTDPMCLNVSPGGRVHQKAMVTYYKEKMIYIYLQLIKNKL